jgi:hypothetical protein
MGDTAFNSFNSVIVVTVLYSTKIVISYKFCVMSWRFFIASTNEKSQELLLLFDFGFGERTKLDV